MAFLPDPLFSVTTDLLIARLLADQMQEKAVQYLVNCHGIGSFNALPCGEWRAKWSSSFKHTEPGYSAYVPNTIESERASHDIVDGGCSKSNLETIFQQSEARFHQRFADQTLKKIEHAPCGPNKFQPNMIRGEGITQGKKKVYDKPFRKRTQQKLLKAVDDKDRVLLECGAQWNFSMVWCFRKHVNVAFDAIRMRELCSLMFAPSVEIVRTHYLRIEGKLSMWEMRRLFADFVLVGKDRKMISGILGERND